VLWDKNNSELPINCFISNFNGKLEQNAVYLVDIDNRNGKINIENYKLVDLL
jgi:hypothetical protein